MNTNSEFVIDSYRESGEEPVNDLKFRICTLLNPKLEFQNPNFLLIVRFCLRHVLHLA